MERKTNNYVDKFLEIETQKNPADECLKIISRIREKENELEKHEIQKESFDSLETLAKVGVACSIVPGATWVTIQATINQTAQDIAATAGIVAGATAASIPIIEYIVKKQYYEKETKRLNKEIQNLEEKYKKSVKEVNEKVDGQERFFNMKD